MQTNEKLTNKNAKSDIVTNRNRSSKTPTPFSFYKKLNYPLPIQSETFSRNEKSLIMTEYLSFINQRKRIFKYIPYIEEVFLANSITFNALKKDSDIDLFIITDPHHLWTTRLATSLIMYFFNIKRSKKKIRKRFCLSFFVSSQQHSIQELLLNEQDIYLPYRIAHLVPLYQKKQKSDSEFGSSFWKDNLRIKNFLPHRNPKQHIFLDIKIEQGRGILRKIFELIFSGIIGNLIEKIIITLWLPLIQKKKNKNPDLHHGVIFNTKILKFHHDKRAEISQKTFG